MPKKIQKKLFFSEIIASELVSLNCPTDEEDTFLSAANVLTSSSKILHVNKRDFLELNLLGSDWWIW